jgi:hypothetical protein
MEDKDRPADEFPLRLAHNVPAARLRIGSSSATLLGGEIRQ